MNRYSVRIAAPDDADGIFIVLRQIAEERVHSAIVEPWPVDRQRAYLESLSSREAFHVAVTPSGEVIGYQSLDLFSPYLPSMSHVAQVGTFLLPKWRRQGVGGALFLATEAFARAAGFRKIVIQVRASNTAAAEFYRRLGFEDCGRLRRQVIVAGVEDDEIILERFLDGPRTAIL